MRRACRTWRIHENLIKMLAGKREGKTIPGMFSCNLEDNIKIDFEEIGFE
jgi:hypothetical protein